MDSTRPFTTANYPRSLENIFQLQMVECLAPTDNFWQPLTIVRFLKYIVDINDIMIVYYIVAFKMMVVFFVVVKCHVERKYANLIS